MISFNRPCKVTVILVDPLPSGSDQLRYLDGVLYPHPPHPHLPGGQSRHHYVHKSLGKSVRKSVSESQFFILRSITVLNSIQYHCIELYAA